MLYRYCDLALSSTIPIPELLLSEKQVADLEFVSLPVGNPDDTPIEWFHEQQLGIGKMKVSIARQEFGYLLRYSNAADFLIFNDDRRIHCKPRPDLPEQRIRDLLLDQVMPLVLSQREEIVLHASAVADERGAIAFVGPTGLGKSTLAIYLTQQGYRFVTDDCLVVRKQGSEFIVVPSYPSFRMQPIMAETLLGPDPSSAIGLNRKRRIGPGDVEMSFSHEAVPLRRIFFLAPPIKPAECEKMESVIKPMSPSDALGELMRSSFRLDCQNYGRLRAEFGSFGPLARAGLAFHLENSRDLRRIPNVFDEIRWGQIWYPSHQR